MELFEGVECSLKGTQAYGSTALSLGGKPYFRRLARSQGLSQDGRKSYSTTPHQATALQGPKHARHAFPFQRPHTAADLMAHPRADPKPAHARFKRSSKQRGNNTWQCSLRTAVS